MAKKPEAPPLALETSMPWVLEFHRVGEGEGRIQAFKFVDGVRLWANMEEIRIWEHVDELKRRLQAAEALNSA